jgi:hypothetical protein
MQSALSAKLVADLIQTGAIVINTSLILPTLPICVCAYTNTFACTHTHTHTGVQLFISHTFFPCGKIAKISE